MTTENTTISRLLGALSEVLTLDGPMPADASTRSLDEMGLDSVAMLSFLVAIEDEFGIEWSDETPKATFRSLASLAEYIDHEFLRAS